MMESRGVIRSKVRFTMSVLATYWQDGSWWFASCDDLDVHTQGKTRDEAHSNLKDALRLFVVSCFERGKLDKVLKDAGYAPDSIEPEEMREKDQAWLDVPLHLVAQNEQNNPGRMGNTG